MSYRQSPHYREAQRRVGLLRRARTDLGRFWHQRQIVEAIKAMLAEKK